jgi:hypothetical protein
MEEGMASIQEIQVLPGKRLDFSHFTKVPLTD